MAKKGRSKNSGKDAAPQKASQAQPSRFHIAAIGASAGGLDPLKRIFFNIKPYGYITYVVIRRLGRSLKLKQQQMNNGAKGGIYAA